LLTAFLTSIYTFRMIYLVFGGADPVKMHCNSAHACKVPRVMEITLIPLALLGLFGGFLNLPSYLGAGWLSTLFSPLTGGMETEVPHSLEVGMQAIAGVIALAGLAVAHFRYGAARRQERIAAAAGPTSAWVEFFLNGWRFDNLYRFIFIRPYEALSRFFWLTVDEGLIDNSLDRLASFLGWSGERIGSWTSGKVSVYIVSFAAGATLLIAYLALFLS
jgi:NADH-quinone oxidoreductase subunit L